MKTAVIYARYSSDKQTEQSIEGQLRICNDYAQRNDIVIVDTYIDRAMTGTNDNRTAFQKMLKDSNKRAWDIVLVYKLDRFSRNKYEMATHKKTLKDNGIKLVSAMENIPDTPEGIILESLLEGMAEYYSAELAQKTKRGMRESRLKGLFTGGHILYGYKAENKKIIIDEEKAEIVRYIFSQYAQNIIVKDIIKDLTSKGILNHGKPFAKNTIHYMLANEKYIGIARHEDEVYTNIYPPIVSNELFDIVHKKIESNKYGKRSQEVVYLLREKVKCGYCGQPITAEAGTSKSGKVSRYYKCLGKKRCSGCEQKVLRKDDLENTIIKTTLKTFQNTNTISFIADKVLECHKENIKKQTTLNHLSHQKQNIQNSIDNILLAIEKGIITSSTKDRLEQLEQEKEELEGSILLEKSKLQVSISKDEVVKFIKSCLRKEPRLMIELFIKQIILYNDKIEIIYNYTEKETPDDENSQGFSFYKGEILMPIILKSSPKPAWKEVNIELKF